MRNAKGHNQHQTQANNMYNGATAINRTTDAKEPKPTPIANLRWELTKASLRKTTNAERDRDQRRAKLDHRECGTPYAQANTGGETASCPNPHAAQEPLASIERARTCPKA